MAVPTQRVCALHADGSITKSRPFGRTSNDTDVLWHKAWFLASGLFAFLNRQDACGSFFALGRGKLGERDAPNHDGEGGAYLRGAPPWLPFATFSALREAPEHLCPVRSLSGKAIGKHLTARAACARTPSIAAIASGQVRPVG